MNRILQSLLNKKIAGLLLFALLVTVNAAEQPRKKILDLAWGSPTVDFLAANLEQMEKEAPVDGLMIRWIGEMDAGNGKKKSINLTHCMNQCYLLFELSSAFRYFSR